MRILLKTSIFVCLLISIAQARVRHIPIEDIPGKADFVFVGKVIGSSSRWNENKTMIFTDYKIKIEENIHGSKSSSQIVMSFAGGKVGDEAIIVTEVPALKKNKTYILFGYENRKSSIPVVGAEQGIFSVVHDNVKNMDFVVDYHGRLLEKIDNRDVIAGDTETHRPRSNLW